ncbi:glycosyltransferase family 4 protein [Flavobacterium sp.]|uniref:glycosyltransferase family 4 protein n=1 Tax=Flavobacterium sp. TaxID=239 RepID=UPI0035AFB7E6
MTLRKKILIHSIVFSPDGVSTAYLYKDIAKAFKEHGFEVVVLTTTPHYNIVPEELIKQPLKKKFFGFYYESNFNGVKVLHIPQKKFKSTLLRIVGFIFWHLMALVLGLGQRNINAILSPSPPLTIGFVNLIIGKIKKAKVVYNVQEIYPDFLIEKGGLKSKPIIRILKWLERFVYNKSDAVTTIDQIFYDTVIERFENKSKLHIIPNFVDTDLYHPLSYSSLKIDNSLFKANNNLKLMYAGNVGHAQDWYPLIETAKKMKNDPIDFYVIGEGVMKKYIEDQKKEYSLENLYILPYQPREMMPQLLAFADLQYIFMSKEMEGHGFPSKVYTIMACGKPMLICSGDNTPIVNFLKDLNCAEIISTADLSEKVAHIEKFLKTATEEKLRILGSNGLKTIENHYTKQVVTKKYVNLINNLFFK